MPSSRDLVVQHVTEKMMRAFIKGDMVDAQNLEAFVSSLEGMTDSEYELLVAQDAEEAIS